MLTIYLSLAAAAYNMGDLSECVTAVQKAQSLRRTESGRDWFYLSMAQLQMGEADDAKKSFQNGQQAMQLNQPGNQSLMRLRKAAESLLESQQTETNGS